MSPNCERTMSKSFAESTFFTFVAIASIIFENANMPLPVQYDRVISQVYGTQVMAAWMEFQKECCTLPVQYDPVGSQV